MVYPFLWYIKASTRRVSFCLSSDFLLLLLFPRLWQSFSHTQHHYIVNKFRVIVLLKIEIPNLSLIDSFYLFLGKKHRSIGEKKIIIHRLGVSNGFRISGELFLMHNNVSSA